MLPVPARQPHRKPTVLKFDHLKKKYHHRIPSLENLLHQWNMCQDIGQVKANKTLQFFCTHHHRCLVEVSADIPMKVETGADVS